jgi:hypothetical protein
LVSPSPSTFLAPSAFVTASPFADNLTTQISVASQG